MKKKKKNKLKWGELNWEPTFATAVKETPMATDQDMADDIRAKVQKLRDSIVTARNAGLIVDIPLLLTHWLENGTAPGEPAIWVIKRKSL